MPSVKWGKYGKLMQPSCFTYLYIPYGEYAAFEACIMDELPITVNRFDLFPSAYAVWSPFRRHLFWSSGCFCQWYFDGLKLSFIFPAIRTEQQVCVYGNLLARGGFPVLMFGKKQGDIAAFFHNVYFGFSWLNHLICRHWRNDSRARCIMVW